jgi:hypothetical protein
MNFNAAEFMQYRSPVGGGPSGNTWPRWESPCLLLTSVRLVRRLAGCDRYLTGAIILGDSLAPWL